MHVAESTGINFFVDPVNTFPKSRVENGLVFIPDISGFTGFVETTDINTGAQVTADLLSSIIEMNQLNLEVSEIEGDAVLFYRYGPPPPVEEIMLQAHAIVNAFKLRILKWSSVVPQVEKLSIKLIVHYGPLACISIAGTFNKLYGRTIIEAHGLLKNNVAANRYLLLTDDFLNASQGGDNPAVFSEYEYSNICQYYESIGKLCYTCIQLA